MLFISDPTLMTDNVAEVMELLNDWNLLTYGNLPVIIPHSQLEEIRRKCSTKKEIANECASYYVHCHSQPSWTHLAHRLYIDDEIAAVEKLKPFLPLRGKYQVISLSLIHI